MLKSFETERAYLDGVTKVQKRFTVKFSALVNAKAHDIAEKACKGFISEFRKAHDPRLLARRMIVRTTIRGYDKLINLGGDMSQKMHFIRKELEKIKMPIEGSICTYEQLKPNETPHWQFDVTFYDVDPTDPFTGTGAWEAYR